MGNISLGYLAVTVKKKKSTQNLKGRRHRKEIQELPQRALDGQS